MSKIGSSNRSIRLPAWPLRAAGKARRCRHAAAGAIAVSPQGAAMVRGRKILLIDDVPTTGATASACCRALLQAGAASADVLTSARVVRPD